MGYRGLLLNDPYKIDRMGCVCGYGSYSSLLSSLCFCCFERLLEPRSKIGKEDLKWGYLGF
jgi:hypothetical protein